MQSEIWMKFKKTMNKTYKLLLVIFLFIIIGVKGQTNWSIISKPGVYLIIVNQTTGYSYTNESIGSHGMKYTLKKSTDGFQSFATIKTKIGDFGCYGLDEMYFIDADTGFIAELYKGLTSIYKTMDGGQTWTETGFGGTAGISMYFLHINSGYYVFSQGIGNDSYLIKNGNVIYATRKYIFTKDNYHYPNLTTEIKFINDSTGFIICKDTLDNAVILKSSNFGSNWSEKMVLSSNIFRDVFFISDSVGFVVGTNGYILKTNDCGENWQRIYSNTSNCLNSIDFHNDSIGYIVGDNGQILKTQNQGELWSAELFCDSINLMYVRLFEDDNVYINDINGTLYCNKASSIIKLDAIEDIIIHPNPTKDYINILIPKEIKNYEISLFDIQGDNILTTSSNRLNLESLKSGVYLIRIVTDKHTYEKKIIKQ